MNATLRHARTPDGATVAYLAVGSGRALVRVTQVRWNHIDAWRRVAPYRRMAEQLAERHTFVTYDSRGTGASRAGTPDFSLDAQLADLEGVLGELKHDQVALLGWQMGSLAAVAFAARNPSRVSSLVLLNPHANGREFLNVPQIRARAAYRAGGDPVWREYLTILAMEAVGYDNSGLVREVADIMASAMTPDDVRRHAEVHGEIDVTRLLSSVRCPVLVAVARECPWAKLSHAVANQLPHSRLLEFDGFTQLWLPEEVTTEVLDFLSERPGPSRSAVLETARLTARELQVLKLVADGENNTAIAMELGISVNTVLHHMTNIFHKTGSRNRAEAVSFGYRNGLLE